MSFPAPLTSQVKHGQVYDFVSQSNPKLPEAQRRMCKELMAPFDDIAKLANLTPYELDLHVQSEKCCSLLDDSMDFMHAVVEAKGDRGYMEDRHRVVTYPPGKGPGNDNCRIKGFYSVFDGHSGERCSTFCNLHFYKEFLARLEADDFKSIPQAYADTFQSIEYNILDMSRRNGWDDGSTCCSVLVTEKSYFCGNAGDARAVLSRNAKAVELSNDHKPSRPLEQERVLAHGGKIERLSKEQKTCFCTMTVQYGPERVFPGGIAVTRGLGDLLLKDPTKGKVTSDRMVIPDAEVTEIARSESDEFLIIASDGLWDALSSQDAVNMVFEVITNNESVKSLRGVAQQLADYACHHGSGDNVTVIIVFLNLKSLGEYRTHELDNQGKRVAKYEKKQKDKAAAAAAASASSASSAAPADASQAPGSVNASASA